MSYFSKLWANPVINHFVRVVIAAALAGAAALVASPTFVNLVPAGYAGVLALVLTPIISALIKQYGVVQEAKAAKARQANV